MACQGARPSRSDPGRRAARQITAFRLSGVRYRPAAGLLGSVHGLRAATPCRRPPLGGFRPGPQPAIILGHARHLGGGKSAGRRGRRLRGRIRSLRYCTGLRHSLIVHVYTTLLYTMLPLRRMVLRSSLQKNLPDTFRSRSGRWRNYVPVGDVNTAPTAAVRSQVETASRKKSDPILAGSINIYTRYGSKVNKIFILFENLSPMKIYTFVWRAVDWSALTMRHILLHFRQ